METGHQYGCTVIYSPDNTQIASTGGFDKTPMKIWDAKTGKLFAELRHDPRCALSLAWTSDGKILVAASNGPIRIFDTTENLKQIATLKCHPAAHAIALSRNNRLLASISFNNTAQLWNLDTNLPIGPPLQHKNALDHLIESWTGPGKSGSCPPAFSLDGKVLVTGGYSTDVFAWDAHAILKQAGLEDILSTDTNIEPEDILEQKTSQSEPSIGRTSCSSLSDKSFLEADATRCNHEFGSVDELSSRFFDGMGVNDDSSSTGGAHPHSSANALLARLASLLHHFRPNSAEPNEPLQPRTLSGLHLRVLFARLSPFIRRSLPEHDAPNELQQPSAPSRSHLHVTLARLSSLFPRSQFHTEDTEPHTVTRSRLRPNALMVLLSSHFRSQHRTNEEFDLSQRVMRTHVVEVAPMRDREVLFVAERAQADRPHYQSVGTAIPGARPVHSRPIRLLGHIGLFLCCVCNHQHVGDSAQETQQQQGQSQGPVLTQASSLQTTPAALSTTATSTVSDIHTTAPITATV